jgi:hypothetical protein
MLAVIGLLALISSYWTPDAADYVVTLGNSNIVPPDHPGSGVVIAWLPSSSKKKSLKVMPSASRSLGS